MPQREPVHFWNNGAILFTKDGAIREKAREFLEEVIREHAVPIQGECWTLPGKRHNPEGYRYFQLGKKTFMGHRFVYEVVYGPIPDNHYVMHSCDTPACVNPDHLVAGTPRQNSQDMVQKGRYVNSQAQKTHCKRGHAFSEKNTYVFFNKKLNAVARICRACSKERKRESAHRHLGRRMEYQRQYRAKKKAKVYAS